MNKQKNKKQTETNKYRGEITYQVNKCKLHVYAANSEREKISCELFEIEGGI